MYHFQGVNRNSCPGGANQGFSIGIVGQGESCVHEGNIYLFMRCLLLQVDRVAVRPTDVLLTGF